MGFMSFVLVGFFDVGFFVQESTLRVRDSKP